MFNRIELRKIVIVKELPVTVEVSHKHDCRDLAASLAIQLLSDCILRKSVKRVGHPKINQVDLDITPNKANLWNNKWKFLICRKGLLLSLEHLQD